MSPHAAAAIYAAVTALALVGVLFAESVPVRYWFRVYPTAFWQEVVLPFVFFPGLAYFLVWKNPSQPTRLLVWLSGKVGLHNLKEPIQRLGFIALCIGMLAMPLVVGIYAANDHKEFFSYFSGGKHWISSTYRLFFSVSLAVATIGLCCSYLYPQLVRPLVGWVKGKQPPRSPGDA